MLSSVISDVRIYTYARATMQKAPIFLDITSPYY